MSGDGAEFVCEIAMGWRVAPFASLPLRSVI
jgi:hypothetical protein